MTRFVAMLLALMAYMVGAVLMQVFGRYVFNYSITAAVETATFAQIWMVLLGAGYAMRQRMHVNIDVVIQMLPAHWARLLLVPVAGLCLWFLWVVFVGGVRLLDLGAIQRSPALQIPMTIPYLALPLAAVYFALEAFRESLIMIHSAGFSDDEIQIMAARNPAQLFLRRDRA